MSKRSVLRGIVRYPLTLFFFFFKRYNSISLRVCLDWAENSRLCLQFSIFFFYAFVRLAALWDLLLLFMHCLMNSSHKVWLFSFFQSISAHRVVFMDSQISLFNNFFIKNRYHGTIHTFKNYFTIIFFNFQFSTIFKWTLNNVIGMATFAKANKMAPS